MFGILRMGLATLAFAAIVSAPAIASENYFEVTTANGPKVIGPADYAAIGEAEISTKVLTMGDGKHSVSGVLGRALIDYVNGSGATMRITAIDGYEMEVPVADLKKYDVVIATAIDGKALSVRDKGPAWLIYPVSDHKELDDTIYESRSVWQIKSIKFE